MLYNAYLFRQLLLPDDAAHFNPNGGAMVLGHPLSIFGAWLVGLGVG